MEAAGTPGTVPMNECLPPACRAMIVYYLPVDDSLLGFLSAGARLPAWVRVVACLQSQSLLHVCCCLPAAYGHALNVCTLQSLLFFLCSMISRQAALKPNFAGQQLRTQV